MAGFQWFGLLDNGATFEDVANFSGVQIIFRHICVIHEGAEFAFNRNRPAGFLESFAVKRGCCVFALVDAATGQLEFVKRRTLVCDQQITPAPVDGPSTTREKNCVSLQALHARALKTFRLRRSAWNIVVRARSHMFVWPRVSP